MELSRSLKISVRKPCHQPWENMIPADAGRHCGECSKTVIDFTGFTDAELFEYFSKPQGKVCGRFLSTQLSTQLHIPPQPHSRLYRLTVALGLSLLFSQSTATFAQSTKDRPQGALSSPASKEVAGEKRAGALTGHILDALGHPVPNASVHFYRNGRYEKMVYTDAGGTYVVKGLPFGLYKVVIEAEGFGVKAVENIKLNVDSVSINPVVLNIYQAPEKRDSEVIVTGEPAIDSVRDGKEVMGKIKYRPVRRKNHRGRR